MSASSAVWNKIDFKRKKKIEALSKTFTHVWFALCASNSGLFSGLWNESKNSALQWVLRDPILCLVYESLRKVFQKGHMLHINTWARIYAVILHPAPLPPTYSQPLSPEAQQLGCAASGCPTPNTCGLLPGFSQQGAQSRAWRVREERSPNISPPFPLCVVPHLWNRLHLSVTTVLGGRATSFLQPSVGSNTPIALFLLPGPSGPKGGGNGILRLRISRFLSISSWCPSSSFSASRA